MKSKEIEFLLIKIFKKKFKVAVRPSKTGVLKKGPFWAASKGRTNWRETAFSPCEAELKCTPRGPPGTPPKRPLFAPQGRQEANRFSTM
mgnify:CR=1 FL=1